jgi:adenylate kinase
MKKIKNFENFEINERELPDNQGEILVILGAPGSGKGTLSKELKKDYGFVHISTGDVIRNSEDPELKKIIDGGNLVPDDMMIKILKKELNKLDPEDDIILDGFPRTIKQARKLDSMLGKMGLGLNHALYLSLPDDIAKERIRGRAKKEGRKDDASEEIIENRFKEYKEKTFPLVDFYKKSRKLVTVNAEDGKDVVLDKVIKKFDLKKKSK